jgi:hypothetical protein
MACAGHGVGHTGQLRGVDLHELRRSCLTGPASSVGRDDIEGLFGHDVTGPGPAGPSGSALGLGKLAFGSGRGGTHTAMSTNYDLDIVGRVRRASGDIPQSVDDLYLVADVQGVVEGLRGGLGEVHATVRADGDAVLVEGVAAVEEHRVRHRRVVELAAAVVQILPGHVEGSWSGRCAGLAGRHRDRPIGDVAASQEPGLLGGQVDAGQCRRRTRRAARCSRGLGPGDQQRHSGYQPGANGFGWAQDRGDGWALDVQLFSCSLGRRPEPTTGSVVDAGPRSNQI